MSQLSVPPFSRRSLLTGLGAGAAGLGLAACGAPGGGDDDADEPVRDGFGQADVDVPSEYSDRTPILFWAPFTGNNFEAVQHQFKRFNESQDEIVAIAESQGSYEDLHQKLTAALQSQAVPDIVSFPEMQWLQYYFSGAFASLDDYFDDEWNLDVYLEPFSEEGKAAGSTYLVPFARSTPIFYYNKEQYRQAGLPEEGPSTWDDLAWYSQGEIWGFGGAYSDGFDVTVNDDPVVEMLEFQRKFIHDDGYGFLGQSAAESFTTQVAAGIRASTASLTGLTADSSFEVGCAFIPGQVHTPTEVPTGGAGLAIVRSDSKERQDACAELFRFLAQPEMAAEWHRDTGYIPIVEESLETDIVTDLVDENPNYGVALAQLEHAKTADLTNWLRENINEIKTRFSTVYGDNAEVKPMLDELAETMQANLDDSRDDLEEVLGS